MEEQSLEKCIDFLNRVNSFEYVPEKIEKVALLSKVALKKVKENPEDKKANQDIESIIKNYDMLEQLLDTISVINKQRSVAFRALEEIKNLSGGDVLPDEYDQVFIDNNYGLFCAMLEKDIYKHLKFEEDKEYRKEFLNDIKKIKKVFNNIVLDDFKIGKDKNNEIYINKIIPENALVGIGTDFLSARLIEIISMHNRYCVSRTQKQVIDKLQTFFNDDNYKLLDDDTDIINIKNNIISKLSVFKNCNFVKTNEECYILEKEFYGIQELFDDAARTFLETKDKKMLDKFTYFRETSPEEFVEAFKKAKELMNPAFAWHYDTTLTSEDYKKKNAKCFISPFKSVFAISENGEIISLCCSKEDRGFISMNDAINFAKEQGGDHLTCLSGFTDVYLENNFEEISFERWNKEIETLCIANGWKPDYGKEDLVHLALKNEVPEKEKILLKEEDFYNLPLDDLIGTMIKEAKIIEEDPKIGRDSPYVEKYKDDDR